MDENELLEVINKAYENKAKELDLASEELTSLPPEIGKLKNLLRLDLSRNQLTSLQPEFGNLNKSLAFWVDDNPLVTPPIEIARNGINAIREFFDSLEKQSTITVASPVLYTSIIATAEQKPEIEKRYEAKLIIVGQGDVGKTSILRRLIDNSFSETQETTKGIEIKSLTLKIQDNQNIKLNVWDFGGQEIYHATHQFFLTKRSVYMLVWDARQEDEYGRIEHWLNTIKVFGVGSPVILVLNKYDEYAGDINLKDLKERFPGIIQGFYRVSCKEPDKVHDSFDKLKADIAEIAAQLPHMGSDWPQPWIKIREQLENDTRNHIEYSEFQKLCNENGIEAGKENVLDEYLHDLGVFLHFKDDLTLHNTIIIKPSWGTNAVYKVVSSRAVIEGKGILHKNDLTDIWKKEDGYPKEKHDVLLNLMKRLELSFQIEKKENHVIASALTKESVDIDWDLKGSVKVIYEYDFLPKTVIPRFIVRAHELIKRDENQNYLCWRTGAILQKIDNGNKTKAYIRAYPNDRKIEITIAGDKKREILTTIRNHFESIHEITKNLKADLKVPCPCFKDCKYLFEYDFLTQMEIQGELKVNCGKTAKPVSLKELLEHTKKYDVFISHARKDKDTIENEILRDLKTKGISYWIDHEKIGFGERIIEKIEEGLKDSKHIMPCLSENLGKSNWCRAEYESVLYDIFSKKTDKRVIPLRLDNCGDDDISPFLRGLKMAKYKGDNSYNELLDFLAEQ
ncbi:MAG: TIR domain-containing protein [Nitrospirae bacterium]|nr:TIR domain-containing protein [Nitrospirota bacterium]MBF0535015.1 TIR domain-containing protein [Nitrospirota bacterium]MBF0616523.1 TIR domain-containing protein [Nitrospirota bacterium]